MNYECEGPLEMMSHVQKVKERCHLNPAEYGGPEKCIEVADAFVGSKCYNETNFTNLDSVLSRIDQSTKSIILQIHTNDPVKVDLNKLPTRMPVFLQIEGEHVRNAYTKLDTKADVESMARKSKLMKRMSKSLDLLLQKPIKHRTLKEEVEIPLLKLVGGIKEKVSYLGIYAPRVIEIVDSDLDVPVLGNFVQQFVGPKKAIVDRYYNHVGYPLPGHLTIQELTLFDMSSPDLGIPSRNYTITLRKNNWSIIFIEDEHPIEFEFPYPLTKNIGLLGYLGTNITIHRETEGSLPNLSLDFDIFVPHFGPIGEVSPLIIFDTIGEESKLLEKREIIIYKTGDWSDVAKGAFNLRLGFNSDLHGVNTKELEGVATITTTEPRNPVNEYVTGGNDGDDDDDGPNVGMIVGIVVACVVVVAAIIVVVVIVIRKKKAQVGAS